MSGPWADVARALGLQLGDGPEPWLHGTRNDAQVIVKVTRLYNLDPASRHLGPLERLLSPRGFDRRVTGPRRCLVAIADVDPPLLAGLCVFSRGLGEPFGDPNSRERLGHPALDAAFASDALDVERMRAIVTPAGAADPLGDTMASIALRHPLVLRDKAVEVYAVVDTPDGKQIDELVEIATTIACELGIRGRTTPPNASEIRALAAWSELAEQIGLSFDAPRWRLSGRVGDVEVEAKLEIGGTPVARGTLLRAQFRQPVHHLQTPLRTEARLADPDVEQRAAAERELVEVELTETEALLRRPGLIGGRDLRSALATLVALVDSITPRPMAGGPFR